DLLAFSEVSRVTGRGEPVDLDAGLEDVMSDLLDGPDLSRPDQVNVDRSPLPAVVGHPALLSQHFQNLLANALKFRRDDVPSRIEVRAEDHGDGVVLTVADNGIGIPDQHRHEVFDAFKRLSSDERYTGSGIGLATCAKVADVHEGRIWVDDGIDGGTAIRVWLPSTRLARP